MTRYTWFETDVPDDLEIRQVYGFIFNTQGEILLMEDQGKYNLPGGKPEDGEGILDTLIREAEEEVQVTVNSVEYLGYQLITGAEKFAQVRMVCRKDEFFPSKADPSTGRTYSRHWVAQEHVNKLLEWGDSGDEQIACALSWASKWL